MEVAEFYFKKNKFLKRQKANFNESISLIPVELNPMKLSATDKRTYYESNSEVTLKNVRPNLCSP